MKMVGMADNSTYFEPKFIKLHFFEFFDRFFLVEDLLKLGLLSRK